MMPQKSSAEERAKMKLLCPFMRVDQNDYGVLYEEGSVERAVSAKAPSNLEAPIPVFFEEEECPEDESQKVVGCVLDAWRDGKVMVAEVVVHDPSAVERIKTAIESKMPLWTTSSSRGHRVAEDTYAVEEIKRLTVRTQRQHRDVKDPTEAWRWDD